MGHLNSLVGKILHEIPEAEIAIKAALAKDQEYLISNLRTAVVRGNLVDAAICEGKLQALEDVPSLLTRFAKQASPAKQE